MLALNTSGVTHAIQALTATPRRGYASSVTANSVARFGDRKDTRRTSALRESGAFFAPELHVCGGRAWETSGSAGFRVCRFANLRTAAPILFGDSGSGSDNTHGVPTMAKLRLFPTRDASARAAAHRAMARAALFSNCSTRTRLKRYNHHMHKARRLEVELRAEAPSHALADVELCGLMLAVEHLSTRAVHLAEDLGEDEQRLAKLSADHDGGEGKS